MQRTNLLVFFFLVSAPLCVYPKEAQAGAPTAQVTSKLKKTGGRQWAKIDLANKQGTYTLLQAVLQLNPNCVRSHTNTRHLHKEIVALTRSNRLIPNKLLQQIIESGALSHLLARFNNSQLEYVEKELLARHDREIPLATHVTHLPALQARSVYALADIEVRLQPERYEAGTQLYSFKKLLEYYGVILLPEQEDQIKQALKARKTGKAQNVPLSLKHARAICLDERIPYKLASLVRYLNINPKTGELAVKLRKYKDKGYHCKNRALLVQVTPETDSDAEPISFRAIERIHWEDDEVQALYTWELLGFIVVKATGTYILYKRFKDKYYQFDPTGKHLITKEQFDAQLPYATIFCYEKQAIQPWLQGDSSTLWFFAALASSSMLAFYLGRLMHEIQERGKSRHGQFSRRVEDRVIYGGGLYNFRGTTCYFNSILQNLIRGLNIDDKNPALAKPKQTLWQKIKALAVQMRMLQVHSQLIYEIIEDLSQLREFNEEGYKRGLGNLFQQNDPTEFLGAFDDAFPGVIPRSLVQKQHLFINGSEINNLLQTKDDFYYKDVDGEAEDFILDLPVLESSKPQETLTLGALLEDPKNKKQTAHRLVPLNAYLKYHNKMMQQAVAFSADQIKPLAKRFYKACELQQDLNNLTLKIKQSRPPKQADLEEVKWLPQQIEKLFATDNAEQDTTLITLLQQIAPTIPTDVQEGLNFVKTSIEQGALMFKNPAGLESLKELYECIEVSAHIKKAEFYEVQADGAPLIMSCKPWTFDQSAKQGNKIMDTIITPFNFNADSPPPSGSDLFEFPIENGNGAKATYEIRGIISHIGTAAKRGHYVSYRKQPNTNSWTCYDDEIVIPNVDLKQRFTFTNSERPYVFFLEKVGEVGVEEEKKIDT